MFTLSSISSGLEFWPVNHTSIYENSESKVLKNVKLLDKISNNWPNELLGKNIHKTLEPCRKSLLTILQCTNTNLVISKWGTFSPFFYL